MAGIISYGAYVPFYRLSQAEIANVWGGKAKAGEKAVANSDEDSITMAVEAGTDCLTGMDRESVDGLYLATTTSPYREKQSASIVAAALDLRQDIIAADFAHSLRSGTIALRAALDAVKSGSCQKVLVIASDCRVPPPDSSFESLFGDGAAAFLIGDSEAAVEIEDSVMTSSDFIDVWRADRDAHVRQWEDRFILTYGYTDNLRGVVKQLMVKSGLEPKDISKVVLYGPDSRSHSGLTKQLGLDPKEQVQDPMFTTLGHTGCAFAPMMLVAALQEAKPGDRLLLGNYGDGADAFMLRATEGITGIKGHRGIKQYMESKAMLPNYGRYLHFRNLMEWEIKPAPPDETNLTIIWRERNALIRGRGHRCRQCGHIQFPPQRICMWCQAKDDLEFVRISDKQGELFTFSIDERAFAPDLPVVLSVVNLDGGGRFYGQMTDKDMEKVDIGTRMELTFRKIHEGGGIPNYFWKCRPVRYQEV